MLKKITLLMALLGMVSCGGGGNDFDADFDGAGGDVQEYKDEPAFTLIGTFYFDASNSNCTPSLYNEVLSFYYNETENFVVISNSQDVIYVSGYPSSANTLSYPYAIDGENGIEESECLAYYDDNNLLYNHLYEKCVSENYTCETYWERE